jgi:chlorobactene glucosyltransferase
MALMKQRGAGMLSLLSTLTHDRWFERLIQSAATMELLRQYPIVRANSTTRRRAFANGQYILIGRDAYERIGGHEALREAVLEDVEMARRCEWHDVPVALLLADGLLHCRMYESYAAFRRGWKRIYTESTNRKPARLRKVSRRVRLVCTILPVLTVVAIGVGIARLNGPHVEAAVLAIVLGSLGTLAFAGVVGASTVLGRSPLWTAPGFIVGAWLVGDILNEAADDLDTGRPTEWAGMAYKRESR